MIIYKATNKINGKVYIGQTSHSLEWRINKHKQDSKSKTVIFIELLENMGLIILSGKF